MTDSAPTLDLSGPDDEYFDSYADPGVHRLMISDHVRTDAYRRALEAAVDAGSTVLDVGTGTGILSMFAARAGAKRVYGIDSSNIVDAARELARTNSLDDRITYFRGRAEELELPEQVDLIVSEWMGFFALAECMFASVLDARDKHLKPGGRMMPSHVRLVLAAIDDDAMHDDRGIGLWEKPVYGFDFRPMIEREVKDLITCAVDLRAESFLGPEATLVEIDCGTATTEDFFFEESVELKIDRDGTFHGVGGWFEVDLAPGVVLTCTPREKSTHWRQSFFPVRPFAVLEGDVLHLDMKATPRAFGDRRLPMYFLDGWLYRGGEEVHRFFYSHAGSFE